MSPESNYSTRQGFQVAVLTIACRAALLKAQQRRTLACTQRCMQPSLARASQLLHAANGNIFSLEQQVEGCMTALDSAVHAHGQDRASWAIERQHLQACVRELEAAAVAAGELLHITFSHVADAYSPSIAQGCS